MRFRSLAGAVVLPVVLALTFLCAWSPVVAAARVPTVSATHGHDLSHPLYHVSTVLGVAAAAGPGKHPNAAFPNAFCRNDTAYYLPFASFSRSRSYTLTQSDGFVSAQLWYLWCPAADSRAAPYGFNFSGGRIASADGQCHTLVLGVPMISGYTDLVGQVHAIDTYAGATLLASGASSTTSADPRSSRTVCPWSPLTTWSGVANGRYAYMAMLNVYISDDGGWSGTGFLMHASLFE